MTQPDISKGYQLSYKLYVGGDLKKTEDLSVDSVTIGRSGTNVIILDDVAVSDLHAVVKLTRDRRLMLTDLGSDEGTFVGGKQVEARIELKAGDRVKVGGMELEFVLVDLTLPAHPSDAEFEAREAMLKQRTDELLDLSADDVVKLLFAAWDGDDRLGVDNRSVPKLLEIFEIWGDTILSARTFTRSIDRILLGDTHEQHPDFFIDREHLPANHTSLVAQVNGQLHLRVPEKNEGELWENGTTTGFQALFKAGRFEKKDGMYLIPLTEDRRFVLRFGHIVLTGAFAHPAKRPSGANRIEVDATYLSLILLFFMMFGSAALYMRTIPPPPAMTIEQMPSNLARLIAPKREEVKEKPKEPPKKLEVTTTRKEEPVNTPPPTQAKEVEDRGKKDNKARSNKPDKVALDQAAKDKAAADAALAGIIGNSGLDRGFGPDVNKAAAGLLATTGASSVTGVTGSRGIGFSGGEGAGGVGSIGTKGSRGGAGGDGYGDGYGVGKRKKESANIDVDMGDALVLGAMDKSVIDRVIRDHLAQIRYCYQRELPKNPRLAGKVVVKFTIDKFGAVPQSNIKESSMGNPTVEDCINQRVLQLKFPEPKGGGTVTVSYPFIFKAAG